MNILRDACDAANQGDHERVLKILGDVDIRVLSEDDRQRAACLALEAGSPQIASQIWPAIEDALALDSDADDDDDDIDVGGIDENQKTDFDDIVPLFLRFFGGRKDIYSEQWFDEKRGRNGYRLVENPLTHRVVLQHLQGVITLGQYLLFADESVSFAVIDFDLSSDAMTSLKLQSEVVSPFDHPGLRAYVSAFRAYAKQIQLPIFVEDSGNRGGHIWLFFEPRIPAASARILLQQLVRAAGAQPPDVGLELFPKQDKLGPKGLSSLVKLPFGVHRVTMRECCFLDDSFVKIPHLEALKSIEPVPATLVDALVGRRLVAVPWPTIAQDPHREPATNNPAPAPKNPRSLADALRAIPSELERSACERMLEKCETLRTLVRRTYEGERLSPDEARAIAYTLGLVSGQGTFAREVLVAGKASTLTLGRNARGTPNPTGCNRLRGLGLACSDCSELANASPYATPTLFAFGDQFVHTKPAPETRFSSFENLVEHPIESMTDTLARIEQRLARMEKKEP